MCTGKKKTIYDDDDDKRKRTEFNWPQNSFDEKFDFCCCRSFDMLHPISFDFQFLRNILAVASAATLDDNSHSMAIFNFFFFFS